MQHHLAPRSRHRLLPAAALVVLLLAGCGSTTATGPSSTTNSATSSSTAAQTSTSAPVSSSTAVSTSTAGTTSTPASSTPVSTSSSTATSSQSADALSGTLTIYAAASLKAAFEKLSAQFAAAHPGVTITPITYDGSSTLATQLTGGSEADIFASADDKNMQVVVDAGLVTGTPAHFATNTLQIAVAPGNPLRITGLADLVNPDVDLVLCDDKVPCGSAALKAFAAAGLTAQPVSKEQNVTAVLTKVESGDAGAGLVYRTDVAAAAGKVEGIDFPESAKAVNSYPIAVLKESPNQAAASAFAELVTSAQGQAVLAQLGFAPPQ